MGYYTSFSLEMHGDLEKIEAAEKDLLEESRYADGTLDPEIKELVETGGVYGKLYELDGYLDAVAHRNPDVLIILTGDGEDSDDLWETRWKGDKTETQRAEIPPFKTKELLTEAEKESNNNK